MRWVRLILASRSPPVGQPSSQAPTAPLVLNVSPHIPFVRLPHVFVSDGFVAEDLSQPGGDASNELGTLTIDSSIYFHTAIIVDRA